MALTVPGIHLGIDIHASRPAANTVPDCSFYSCSTHSLIYKSNYAGNSWATWATLGGVTVDDATIATTDITTNNASTSKHGWLKKLSNVSTEYMSGTGVWSTPAGGGSAELLGVAMVQDGSNTATYTSTTTTDADIDATNLKVIFTAPASGKVLVRFSSLAAMTVAANVMHWTVRESTTTLSDATRITEAAEFVRRSATFYITGISAGSHTYKWGWLRDAGSGTMNIFTGPAYGQAVMEVWSAP